MRVDDIQVKLMHLYTSCSDVQSDRMYLHHTGLDRCYSWNYPWVSLYVKINGGAA